MTSAWVVAIGDELVRGRCVDTNSAWIARELELCGLPVRGFTVIGDGLTDLTEAMRQATAQAELVVSTGGLGPTEDDRTRLAAAELSMRPLAFDTHSWDRITARFARLQRAVPESNRRQAMFPVGSRVLDNDHGTAPGFELEVGRSRWLALPGVPAEVGPMLTRFVLPAARHSVGGNLAICSRELHLLGPSEAAAGESIAEFMQADRQAKVGITVHAGLLTVRVVAHGRDLSQAELVAEELVQAILPRVESHLVWVGQGPLPEVLLARLASQGLTLALAESCTGGMLAQMLTAVPGSSQVLRAGYVSYTEQAKVRDLGVDSSLIAREGVVSCAVAAAMAAGAAQRAGTELAVAITGIAGPSGGTPLQPVGTVCFGLADRGSTRAWQVKLPDLGRAWIRERACLEAIAALLRQVPDRPGSLPDPRG